ncbi:MAG TPA: class I SAM-dependent methyltransferase, partial [bacterium]|nr:class I SAM-dependent methyltransferase [bacterium]
MELTTLIAKPAKDYELLDSGTGEKLERCGPYLLRRPDPVASWKKSLPESEWKKADAVFLQGEESKGWRKKDGMAEEWEISLGGLRFRIKPSAFKHVGVFPEQEPNWAWISDIIRKTDRTVKVLNLFGYTGGATLAAAAAGAEVSHVDGSKTAVARAKED